MRPVTPVKASGFLTLDAEMQAIALANGILPVNDIFYDVWNDESKILLLYGGYGSGKSVFIIDKLIEKARNNGYFRCFYGRKVYDSVRVSVFATITDRIEERGLQHLFSYSKADNSSMIIRCRANGNSFNPFGADNADKLKSVKDPSDIFCEELDQFTEADLGVLLTRLRKPGIKTQLMGAFNTTTVKRGHWLLKVFFSPQGIKTPTKKLFCNYTDNLFLDRVSYEETLWIAAGYNEQKYREIAAGEWGSDEKDNVFAWAFRSQAIPAKHPGYCHIINGLEPMRGMPIYLAFDFNVDPMTCLVCQHPPDKSWISILAEIRLADSDIYMVCDRIRSEWPGAFFYVTGDATGRRRSSTTKGGKNAYHIIKSELHLNNSRFHVPSINPKVKDSRVLTNSILAKHPAILIDEQCKYLVEDLRFVTVDEHGEIDKTKDKHKTHLLDCLRYYFNTYHVGFILKK